MGRYRNWWWVGVFSLCVGFVYLQAMHKKRAYLQECMRMLSELETVERSLLLEKEHLQLRIASQQDPAWIEMILMRDLGVVPEGFLKVYFKK